MRKYELMLIVKALLPDDVRNKALDSVKKIVSDNGGAVRDTDIWGKKYLAYKIQGHAEGYYVVYKLELPEEKAEEVRGLLQHQPELLRFVLLNDGEGEFSVKVGKKGDVLAFDTEIKDIKE